MSLVLKCGLIILDTISLYMASTPPVNAAQKEEQIVPGFIERVQRIMQSSGSPIFIKAAYTICSVAELAVIAAREFPENPNSAYVLSALTFPGKISPNIQGIRFTEVFLIGSFLVTLGGLLRVWCFRTLGKHFTFEMSLLKTHKLVTWGPYNLVRHPSYTGAIIMLLGGIISRGCQGSWLRESGFLNTFLGKAMAGIWILIAVLSFPGFMARVKTEDEFLKGQFKGQWKEWSKRVRYRFIPLIH